jgi:TetR/AcrR family transcriptional regulator, transcriptional repressor for nem operon
MPSTPADTSTADRILDAAEHLVQTRGFNGFSYADIADVLSIRKPSIHHHFPTKAKLGERMLDRYNRDMETVLARVDAISRGAREALRNYTGLYGRMLRDRNRMCVFGMMAAEVSTMPPAVCKCIRQFFDRNEAWLAQVMGKGRRARELSFRGSPLEAARRLLASLEGAMLVARAYDDPQRFDRHIARMLTDLKV